MKDFLTQQIISLILNSSFIEKEMSPESVLSQNHMLKVLISQGELKNSP
jgi:hypothetical protein